MTVIQTVENRPLSGLKPNPLNPRGSVSSDDPRIVELASSISEKGVLQPLIVLPDGTVVAGHRRLEACRLAGLSTAPVIVRDMSETEQLEFMLIENIQREELTPMQIAGGYGELHRRNGSIREIALKMGCHYETVRKYICLLNMPESVQTYFNRHLLPIGLALGMSRVKSETEQLRLAELTVSGRYSIRDIENIIDGGSENTPENQGTTAPAVTVFEKKRQLLDTSVDRLGSVRERLSKYEEFRPYAELILEVEDKLIEEIQEIVRQNRN